MVLSWTFCFRDTENQSLMTQRDENTIVVVVSALWWRFWLKKFLITRFLGNYYTVKIVWKEMSNCKAKSFFWRNLSLHRAHLQWKLRTCSQEKPFFSVILFFVEDFLSVFTVLLFYIVKLSKTCVVNKWIKYVVSEKLCNTTYILPIQRYWIVIL